MANTYINFYIARVFALLLAVSGLEAHAIAPLEIWPTEAQALDAGKLQAQLAVLDKAAGSLPKTLQPALQFQKVFLQMISTSAQSTWRADLEKLSQLSGGDPVAQGAGELAKVWLARVQMQDLGRLLRDYYRDHVNFPRMLGQVERDIPKNLRTDPWGKPWVYAPQAPKGFSRLAGQRYQLGPERFPQLSTFKEATGKRPPVSCSWKVILRDMGGGGAKALEFRSLSATSSAGVIQPGGRFEGSVLLHIGEQWALMAQGDQLFAVAFER